MLKKSTHPNGDTECSFVDLNVFSSRIKTFGRGQCLHVIIDLLPPSLGSVRLLLNPLSMELGRSSRLVCFFAGVLLAGVFLATALAFFFVCRVTTGWKTSPSSESEGVEFPPPVPEGGFWVPVP